LTESLAHYVGNCVWPWQDPYGTLDSAGHTRPNSWVSIASQAGYHWEFLTGGGWDYIWPWKWVATTYNYKDANGQPLHVYDEDRLHLWAFGYFLANYLDFQTGFTGVYGSAGYSPLGSGGWGGSWNAACVLLLMGDYGYTAQNALKFVYSPAGKSYSADMYTMSSTLSDNTLSSKYYWYWWVLAYYS